MLSTNDKETVLELELRNIYYNPATGYQSSEKLYQKAVEDGITVSRKQVKEWLHTQSTYTTHFPKQRHKPTQRTYVKNLADQLQMDLVDLAKYGSINQDTRWILTGIEILSRFAFAIPVQRKNIESMVPAVTKMTTEFKSHFKKYPDVVQFDNGLEFYNKGVKSLLKNLNIDYFSSRKFRKAALVERFNRTLKTRMWKYFTKTGTNVWIDVLPQFISSYNNTIHRTIKMKPKDVNDENQDAVRLQVYGVPPIDLPKPKFKINDLVRIPIVNKRRNEISDKGFTQNFTEEIFKVSAVYRGRVVMYNIEHQKTNENLLGKYYEWELVKVK